MTKLQHLRPLLLRSSKHQFSNHRLMSKLPQVEDNDPCKPNADEKSDKKVRPVYVPETPTTIDEIEEPTTCCMSGCANCVWIEYAEKLSTVLKDSQTDVQKLIMDKVQDPNMRAFLSMELRVRKLIE